MHATWHSKQESTNLLPESPVLFPENVYLSMEHVSAYDSQVRSRHPSKPKASCLCREGYARLRLVHDVITIPASLLTLHIELPYSCCTCPGILLSIRHISYSMAPKSCTLCDIPRSVLVRCQIDESAKWHFVCPGACWKSVSGGVEDAKGFEGQFPWYRYGGMVGERTERNSMIVFWLMFVSGKIEAQTGRLMQKSQGKLRRGRRRKTKQGKKVLKLRTEEKRVEKTSQATKMPRVYYKIESPSSIGEGQSLPRLTRITAYSGR